MAEHTTILFFDGLCNLCNGFIDLVMRRDKKQQILVASLQGQTAYQKLSPEQISQLDTVVLLHRGEVLTKSQAIFKVCQLLGGSFHLLRPFGLLPRFLTDWAYDRVANSRYRLFGKKQTCRLPTPGERQRFLD